MAKLYSSEAPVYDSAFSADPTPEVEWLLHRLGPDVRAVLEPGCGSGRLFPAFVRRGVEVVGLDNSAVMLDRARSRMKEEGLPEPTLHEVDMSRFDLGRTFDGAVCPLGTMGYLSSRQAALEHLEAMARHLAPGRRYMVQLGLRSLSAFRLLQATEHTRWEFEHDGVRMRLEMFGRSFDRLRNLETQVAHFEALSGTEAGQTWEDVHTVRVWDWKEWSLLVQDSPFRQSAAYDGAAPLRPELPAGPGLEERPLVWHELERR